MVVIMSYKYIQSIYNAAVNICQLSSNSVFKIIVNNIIPVFTDEETHPERLGYFFKAYPGLNCTQSSRVTDVYVTQEETTHNTFALKGTVSVAGAQSLIDHPYKVPWLYL